MTVWILALTQGTVLGGLAGILICYLGIRAVLGHRAKRTTLAEVEDEGVLRAQSWVRVGFRFPMLYRTTFCHVYLSKRRLILIHFLFGTKILQAPLGPKGAPGKEGARFEKEKRGNREVLSLRTTMRGGGRIRLYVDDAAAWLKEIVEHD
ncbi:MAG: hypothetical protein KJ645_11445 [Planctomycetes bacterium]|nr:hypothetical protein [Planctomycetota bacterium]